MAKLLTRKPLTAKKVSTKTQGKVTKVWVLVTVDHFCCGFQCVFFHVYLSFIYLFKERMQINPFKIYTNVGVGMSYFAD